MRNPFAGSGRQRAAESARADAAPASATPRELQVEAAATRWRARLADLAGNSPLWDISTLGDAIVELTAAHPSGIAQLYAGRSTPLSNLVREGSALTNARRRARVVLARTDELAQRFGVAPTYVAMGVATWHTDGAARPQGESAGAAVGSEAEDDPGTTPALADPNGPPPSAAPAVVHAPVLLRQVRLGVHGPEAEIDLELDPAVEINSLFVRELRAHGVSVDPAAIARSTMVEHGFTPRPALEALAELGQVLPGFTLEPRIVLGAFVHPGQALADDLHDHERDLATHDLVAALAGVSAARSAVTIDLPEPDPGDRDPDAERGVGDLDPAQQDVLDAVATGAHLLVDAPPGTDSAGTVAAIVAQAAAEGRRVLYVPGTRRAGQALVDALRRVGLGDLTLDLSNDPRWTTTAAGHLLDGLNPPEPETDTEQRDQDREALRAARRELSDYLDALHTARPPWDASAYDALQALAELTSSRPGPRTTVRVPSEAVRSMGPEQRQHAREQLARAAALGAFRLRAADTPWFGARLTSAEHATATMERVRELDEMMPALTEQLARTAAQTGLDEAATLAEWSEQLVLLDGIRSSLDVFIPQVFERSAADLVAATGTRAWRAQHGADLGWGARRRLRKQAKDMLRPGVAVGDLHSELLDVQSRRDVWRRHCASGGWPRLPEGMSEILATEKRASDLVAELNPVLSGSLGERTLEQLPFAELATRVSRLGADDATLRQLPERAAVLAQLSEMGLGDLLEDLSHRRVPTELVGAEFDLAWWSSVLEEILSDDPVLAGLDSSTLGASAQTLLEKDLAQVESLTTPVLTAVREHIRAVIAEDRPRAQEFYRAVRRGASDLKELLTTYAAVAWAPRPVWVVPPMVVPQVLPATRDVDLLVLDAVQHVPVEQTVSALVRSRQVVVVGDTRRGGTGLIGSLDFLPRLTLPASRSSQDAHLAAFLTAHGYDGVVRPLPEPPGPARIELDVVDGTGMPAPGVNVVESVQAEVDRVVDLVIDHALTRPDESLAVIALNTRHADRVREAVLSVAAGSASVASFFDADRPEAFTVVDIESAAGLRRDAIILTLGFGKTPHGRVLHRFGVLSGPDGAEFLVDALDAVRSRLTMVSCLQPDDLDPQRLRAAGSQMLRDLLQLAADGKAQDEPEETAPEVDRLLVDLAERLWRRGLTVVPRFGRPGGVRIPLAVGHPALPGELLLAVLTDDAEYMTEPSLRRRDRHWVERLASRGWAVRTVYSSAVFMDPQGEAEKLAAVVDEIVATRTDGAGGPAQVALPERLEEDPDPAEPAAGGTGGAEQAGSGDRDSAGAAPADAVPTTTSARGLAMVGAGDVPQTSSAPGDRGPRPEVRPGQPLSRYGDDDFDALVAWISADGQSRTVPELRDALRAELGIARRGTHVDAVLGAAARRSGLAVDKPSAEAADDADAADAGTADGAAGPADADAGAADPDPGTADGDVPAESSEQSAPSAAEQVPVAEAEPEAEVPSTDAADTSAASADDPAGPHSDR